MWVTKRSYGFCSKMKSSLMYIQIRHALTFRPELLCAVAVYLYLFLSVGAVLV